MSKKSRRRNRRLLKAAALIGGLAMLGRGRGTGVSGSDKAKFTSDAAYSMPKNDIEFKETVVSTPKTIMDSMPVRPKKNVLSKRVTDKGEVYTIKGASEGIPKKIGNRKSAFVGDNYIYQDGKPYTKGRYGTFAAQKQMERGALPPQLRVPKIKNLYGGSMSGLADGDFAAKKGGRATKSGFKRKGAAKRGFGRAYKGGK